MKPRPTKGSAAFHYLMYRLHELVDAWRYQGGFLIYFPHLLGGVYDIPFRHFPSSATFGPGRDGETFYEIVEGFVDWEMPDHAEGRLTLDQLEQTLINHILTLKGTA